MEKQRFSVEQIVAVLKQAELGMPVADLTRQAGVSEQSSSAGRSNTPDCIRTRSASYASFGTRTVASRSW